MVVRIPTTLLKQDSGTATVNGFDIGAEPDHVRQSISLIGWPFCMRAGLSRTARSGN